ncbi:hypothetical protein J3A84_05575 [Proteiniclasticum sp. SCR006]|uniref:Uncharacterized protein n=1 Tax=Proteiniclasticum aestuarii TaxID=2817862 RepID=A0A939KGK0_9CLOT|nr:hypothetical protein [Proteiniclasticum aestuarii]MBO1264509.1 hypothetical protein [Proteiniclasticum aestuarii]
MMFDKIFRGYRIVSKSSTLSLSKELVEEINIGFFTDFMSTKKQFRSVGDAITLQWIKDGGIKLVLPENGVSENSMQLKGFLDWYERFNDPSMEKVIERLKGYGFTDITEDEELKTELQNVVNHFDDQQENLSGDENDLLTEIRKYDSGNCKLSQLKQYLEDHNEAFSNLKKRI